MRAAFTAITLWLALSGLVCAVALAVPPGETMSAPAAPMEFRKQAFEMRDDFGMEGLSDCYLQYYYYGPCPTNSWFWGFYQGGWQIWGAHFQVGDISMETGEACDPYACHQLETIRWLDFAGYGTVYPGLFAMCFDVYCSDEEGCPVGPALWTGEPWNTMMGWNYVPVEPPLCLSTCCIDPGPPPRGPRILILGTECGELGTYPQMGADNISTYLNMNCEMHDMSSYPMLYPRPYNSHYGTVHSGWYGDVGYLFYCPPRWLCDGRDTSADCATYGFIELAWRIYLSCTGPSGAEPSTWGSIKSMYK
jgi:hypothetical protein